MKTYKQTKQAVKDIILVHGLSNILNSHLVELYSQGHNVTNVQNAFCYFQDSPKAPKYR